ncbi:MAG: aminotransferase class I/II-fold pyridoxal phosphate-dependent enzyme [Gemmatimonadota bacterium]
MRSRRKYTPEVHLNLNVRGLGPSATLAINERCLALQRAGREVYRLGLGQSPFPVPSPVVEALRLHAGEKDYLPVRGLPELREAVAGYLRRAQGIHRSAEDVLVGPGSKELMFLVQLVYYGDLVIPTPSWVTYAPQARIIGRQVRWLRTCAANEWMLTPDELEAVCGEDPGRPRLVILNYPDNPTGRTYDLAQLEGLAAVARRYRVVLLSDEIYGELDYRGTHVSIARLYPEGTIVSGGLSKWCGAGGWRLGTFVFPPSLRWLLDAMAAVASETYTSTSAPIQYAAVTAYRGSPAIEAYLQQVRRLLKSLGHWVAWQLRRAGVEVSVPQGGFYVFPDFGSHRQALGRRGVAGGEALCERLLEETGVAMLPGAVFGRPAEELTARISFVDFDGARALEGMAHLDGGRVPGLDFLRQYCGRTLRALELLAGWLPG